ncbi:MAG TPA: DsbA family oxidoreductase [Candidatus Paenibacillus intestinavium]|nr:DsbA family oxidoreductase [Candidatus Paenibacillus intestinavium]
MKVEIWSDFVCPFCYIGKTKFENALAEFAHKDKVEVVYKSFELDPGEHPKQLTVGSLAKKYGMTEEKAKEMTHGVASQAAEVGLRFEFDNMYTANTFDVHRLMFLAQEKGMASTYVSTVLEAYFTHNVDIADHAELIKLAVQAGLSEEDAEQVLSSDRYATEVRADEQQASNVGISGVPFFVLNNKYAISGAQPQSVFLNALEQTWAETNPTLVPLQGDDEVGLCGPDNCEIK